MPVRYLDLSVKDAEHKAQLLDAIEKVFDHGRIILGPEVTEFESKVAAYSDRQFAVGVSSGTDALYVALRALGIGPGDEVITTPMSWIATLNAIVLTGATPVFADIGPDLNIDPTCIEEAITPKTKAIVPVHFTGNMCQMDRIDALATKHNIPIVEDAAQAFGAQLANGRKAGSIGKLACFSMNSMKVLHSYGEAGAALTDDAELKDRMESLRYAGTINKEDCHDPSLNFRIQTLQAALLLVELKRIEQIIDRRREIARYYDERLKGIVKCPIEEPGSRHVYYTYTIQAENRDGLQQALNKANIENKVHHPILMPDHTAYKDQFAPNIPQARHCLSQMLSIPNHEKLTEDELAYVVETICNFYGAKP